MTEVTVKLPGFHRSQQEVYSTFKTELKRFLLIVAGRRWGKSRFALIVILKEALETPGVYWYVSPSYPVGSITWRIFRSMVKHLPGVRIIKAERTATFANGSMVVWKSADNADSLRGEGLTGVVVDEASFIRESTWQKELRPALSDKQGWALIITTPNGKNWVYKLFTRADSSPDWMAVRQPTWTNPVIPQSEIDTVREELPSLVFDQEYGAEFVEDGSSIFRKVHDAAILETSQVEKHKGHKLYFGNDLAQKNDFTVVSCICKTCNEQVFLERWNNVEYSLQVSRIANLYKKWQPVAVIVETNNVGTVIIEQLRKAGVKVVDFTTTARSKPDLIESLAVAIESGELKLIDDPVQTNELQLFGLTITRAGHKQYSAPEGYHDDTVMALALAYYGVTQYRIQFY